MNPPRKTDLNLYQGATFNPVLRLRGSNGQYFNWTGYTARMQVRQSYETDVLSELTTENGGIQIDEDDPTLVRLYLNATATAALDFTKALYDIEMLTTIVNLD